jgi:hypothetical protein
MLGTFVIYSLLAQLEPESGQTIALNVMLSEYFHTFSGDFIWILIGGTLFEITCCMFFTIISMKYLSCVTMTHQGKISVSSGNT